MISLLFMLPWRVVFDNENYSCISTSNIFVLRPVTISEPRIVVNVSLDTLNMVHGSIQIKEDP